MPAQPPPGKDLEMLTRNNAALDAQLEERPLAKKQEELQEHDDAQQASTSACVKEPLLKPGNLPKKTLLKNDDHELERLGKVGYFIWYVIASELILVQLLDEVHSRFFSAHAARFLESTGRKTGPLSKTYDVTVCPVLRHTIVPLTYSNPLAHHSATPFRGIRRCSYLVFKCHTTGH
jgi:RNA polymerase II subunit A C-terminal domain phosphatase